MSDIVDLLVDIVEKDNERQGARNPMIIPTDFKQHNIDKMIASYQDLLLYWIGARVVGQHQSVENISNQAVNAVRQLLRHKGVTVQYGLTRIGGLNG